MVDGSRSANVKLRPLPTAVSSIIRNSDKRIIGESTYTKKVPFTKAKLQNAVTFGGEDDSGLTLEEITLSNPANERLIYRFEKPLEVDADISENLNKNIKIYSTANNYIDFEATEKDTTIRAYRLGYIYSDYILENPSVSETTTTNEKDFTKLNLRGVKGTGDSTTQLLNQKKEDIKKYIQSGGTVKAKIRLRGERVGDLIQIETAFDGMKTGIITSMGISFGYEDVADIEVLEWSL